MKGFSNVSLYDYAASNISNSITFLYLSHINNGMHRLYPSFLCSTTNKVLVKTIRIDDLIIKQEKVSKIDFIKMDVEGYEYYVIAGMIDLIRRDKPIILSEFHPPSITESGINPEFIYKTMIEMLGYSYPKHCITGEILDTYEKLEKETNDPKGGINILFSYMGDN